MSVLCDDYVITGHTELSWPCHIRYFAAVVCGVLVVVSVVRESTQGVAAADKDQDEMPLPQLTQEGQYSFVTLVVMLGDFSHFFLHILNI